MSNTDARLTLPTLDRPTELPHIGVEKADASVLAAGGVTGMLAGSYLQLGLLTIPLIIAGVGLGAVVLLASPSHMTGTAYLTVISRSLRSSPYVSNTDLDASTDGSLLDILKDDRSTRHRTHVRRYYPERGVIERDDGRFVAALKLEPQGMDFAERDDWRHLTDTLATLANDALTFPVQVYVTTRPFAMDEYLGPLENRLDESEFQDEETLQALIEEYVETRQTDLEETTTAPPNVYLVVEVGDDEVIDTTAGETTGLARLAQVPLLGIPVSLFVRERSDLDRDERLNRLCEALDRRLTVIESEWVAAVEGADSTRLSLAEWLPLIEEYWTGDRPAASDSGMVRSAPVVTAPTDAAATGPGVGHDTAGSSEWGGVSETVDPQGLGQEASASESATPSIADVHQQQLAPEGLEESFETIRTGDQHCQVMYVEGWPDAIELGALRGVFRRSDIEYDLSIHVTPIDRSTALDRTETRYQSIKGDAEIDADDLAVQEKLSSADETALFRQQVKRGESPFRVSVYVVARAGDADTLHEVSRELRSRFRDPPADATLKTVTGEQMRALESASPVGRNVLEEHGATDTAEVMLGQGVGALLASIQDSGMVDPAGIEMGEHAVNGKPVIVNPFDTGVNYNWTVIGDSGSGKTYFAAQTAIRSLLQDDSTKLVFIDPMQAFEGVARALDATTVRVGGDQSLNPLEIRPPAAGAEDLSVDPLREKIQDVLSLFDNFAHQQGIQGGLGETRSLLSVALSETYERAGITHEIATHDQESPTIRDLLDVLQDMAEQPQEYILRTDRETESVSQYATRLLSLLRPFVDGEYSHLSERSSLEFGDSDAIYMDMSGEEGQRGGGGGLTMQLVFSRAYEYAKESADRVIIVIDEARFFMRHSVNLDFLGQRVRHSRHHDTSIRFYTQNINDFYSHAEAESIINNSAVTVLHNIAEIEEWQDTFDLNDREVNFIQSAATGAEGYSEALIDINGRRFPLQIFATPLEDRLIDFDPDSDCLAELTTRGERSSTVRATGDIAATSGTETPAGWERFGPLEWVRRNGDTDLLDAWERLQASHHEHADLLTGPELESVLQTIQSTDARPAAVLAAALETKIDAVVESDISEHLDNEFTQPGPQTDEASQTLATIETEALDEAPESSDWHDSEDTLRSTQNVDPAQPPATDDSGEIQARWDERLASLADQATPSANRALNNRSETETDTDDVSGDAEATALSIETLQTADRDWARRYEELESTRRISGPSDTTEYSGDDLPPEQPRRESQRPAGTTNGSGGPDDNHGKSVGGDGGGWYGTRSMTPESKHGDSALDDVEWPELEEDTNEE